MARNPKKSVGVSRTLILPIQSYPSQSIRAGRMGRKYAVREALTEALGACDLSREQVASELSRLTGEAISINHINNWTSPAKEGWRFPLEYVAAFAVVTQNQGIIDAALEGTGLAVIGEEEQAYVEFGRIMIEDKKRMKKKKALMQKLGV